VSTIEVNLPLNHVLLKRRVMLVVIPYFTANNIYHTRSSDVTEGKDRKKIPKPIYFIVNKN
jgi:hypothetical protein